MTITTEVLIAAARAIGFEPISKYGIIYFDHPETGRELWRPQEDKAQLMDLQWRLKLEIILNGNDGGGVYFYYDQTNLDEYILQNFNNTFESFATAIILAAAEIGRGME